MRIRVDDLLLFEEEAVVREPFDDLDIGFLMVPFRFHLHTPEVENLGDENPIHADVLDERKVMLLSELEVVVSECRRDVDDARSVLGRDEFGGIYLEPILLILEALVVKIRKYRLVCFADELTPLHDCREVMFLARKDIGNAITRHDICLAVMSDAGIVDVSTDGEGDVSRKGPWGRRPREKIRSRLVDELEADEYRDVRDFLIPLIDLEIRKGRLASGAYLHRLEALVHETLVIERLERPPD